MIIDLLITLALLVPFALAGMLLEKLLMAKTRRPGYARNVIFNASCTVLYFTADIVVGAFFAFYLSRLVRMLPGAGLFALPTPERITAMYVVGCTVLWLVVTDFFLYWWHRLQHTVPWLWAEHEVHHSEEHLNVTSAYRHHWLEAPLKTVAVIAPLTYLLQPIPAIAPIVYFAGFALTCFAHLNARIGFGLLNWLLLTPQMHRIHHSRETRHHDRNLAFIFPLWDVLFGTYYHPHPTEYPETGLASGHRLDSLWKASVWPFLRWTGKA